MVQPERRTRADIVAAAAIGGVVAVVAALIWWTSDARATLSRPATVPAPEPTTAQTVPAALTQRWTAASPATDGPLVMDGNLITGSGHRVDGRDPVTGEVRWSYARDRDLCAVSSVYRYAVAVYPDGRGCGQVSGIDAATGTRGPARSSYADKHVTLSSSGTTVLSYGRTRLELWRSDLVRVMAYGEIDAPVKPSAQPAGTGCELLSAAVGASAVSVLEACPDQADVRLTLLRPGDEDDEPKLRYVPEAGVGPDSGARVLAASDTHTAVYLPSPPRVEVIDGAGTTVGSTPLARPPAPSAAVSKPGGLVTWWTGDQVLVFDGSDLEYRYTIGGATKWSVPQGPAALMAGRMLVPVTDGLGVYNPASGDFDRTIPLPHPAGSSAVMPAVSGTTVFEQRGDTVAASS